MSLLHLPILSPHYLYPPPPSSQIYPYPFYPSTNHKMCSLCADTQHKFHHSHQLYKKSQLREIDIPPRKLLGGRASGSYVDSPKAEDAVFSKFLPYNNADDDGSDPYSSDHFRMYEFKVRKCTRSRSHDWTDCPFAHPGEKARRRDPRRFHYTGTVCSEFRKGHCGKGDNCEFSHGVFECWLHPSRYRTEACKDGKNCKRKVCFFAHSTRQLRIVPEGSSSPPRGHEGGATHCCAFCHSVMASPTSTLMGMAHSSSSPPPSPPISPDFGYHHGGGLSYKDALSELMSSMEGMSMTHEQSVCSPMSSGKMNLPWLDVNFGMEEQNQPQFVMSPCSPSPGSSKFGMGGSSSSRFARVQERNLMEEMSRYNTESVRYNNSSNVNYSNINNNNNGGGGGGNGGTTGGGENNMGGPDLGWVNDLLT